MKLPKFDYAAPTTLDEAVRLLASRGGNTRALSGGQSLIPVLAFRLAAPELVVDLKKIPGLDRITFEENGLTLGAKVRWCDIAQDARLKTEYPLLADAIHHVAHYQIRNRGTVGGSLAQADAAAEMPGIAAACDGEISITGVNGKRVERAADFFLAPMTTTLQPDELITGLRLTPWRAARRWAFIEFARRQGDFAIAGIAAFYDPDAQGRAVNVHIGVIGASDRPHRLSRAEAALEGRIPDAQAIANAATLAKDEVEPSSDPHAPAEYRRALVQTLVQRALTAAATRKAS